MAWTVEKRKRGAWGPDDYFVKNRGKVVGFFPTRDLAEKKKKELDANDAKDKK